MASSRRDLLKCAAAAALTAGTARAASPADARRAPRSDDAGLLYDSTRCIGCQACMAGCKRANALPPDGPGRGLSDAPQDLSGRTKTVIRRADGPDGPLYFKAQCMHCVEPACVSVCMIGALQKGERGVVAYDPERCVGCRYCQVACPFNAPKFEWDSATPQIVKCELCRDRLAVGQEPACTEVCPREAVVFGGRQELLDEARRRIEGEPDRYLDHIYGEHEAGGTQVLVLSAVPFAMLSLPELGNEPQAMLAETIQQGIYKGFLAPMVVYAILAGSVWRNRQLAKGGETGRETGAGRSGERPRRLPPGAPGSLGEGGLT